MNKLTKTVKALLAVARNPWLLNKVLEDDLVWSRYLSKKYGMEQGLPVIQIDHLCPGFSETLEYFAFLDGSSLPTDIALLKCLSRRFNHCRYFEIGTWRGESVRNVFDAGAECYTLDLSGNELLAMGFSEQYAALHGFFSKDEKDIKHIEANSLHFDFAQTAKKFDLIFIDGDHHYAAVKSDTENVFRHLVHENSVVVWHDYAYTPEKTRPEVLAAIVDGTPPSHRSYLYQVSNTMCAICIKGSFETRPLVSPVVPDKLFTVKIESRRL